MMQFDLPKDASSIIKVIGVGGGGSNALNHMYQQGIYGVDFVVTNTDRQALNDSPVPNKIQLGESLTGGHGAGAIPEVGKNAAIESIDEVRGILAKNTSLVFVTAGLGGGTGTGAAPIIAKLAKEMGILTIGIVTMPFDFEGRKRKLQAEEGLKQMKAACDTLIVVKNDKLRAVYGGMTLKDAFAKADDVLAVAARGIAEVIALNGKVNLDMNDVRTVMTDSGLAIMGYGEASGENRARLAIEQAIESPLLNDNDIYGAKYILLNITLGGNDVRFEELYAITEHIQQVAGEETDLIWGYGYDESLGDKIRVSIVATGFESHKDLGMEAAKPAAVKVSVLEEDLRSIEKPITSPTERTAPSTSTFSMSAKVEKPEEEPYIAPKPIQKEEEEPVFKFDFKAPEEPKAEEPEQKVTYTLDDDYVPELAKPIEASTPSTPVAVNTNNANDTTPRLNREESARLIDDRLNMIKQMNQRLQSQSGLGELEKEPAFNRLKKKFEVKTESYSSENSQSRFTLSENGEIRKGNSFLHDNVD